MISTNALILEYLKVLSYLLHRILIQNSEVSVISRERENLIWVIECTKIVNKLYVYCDPTNFSSIILF